MSKPVDPAPAYEDLFEQRPQNTRTGYSQIPPTDPETDLENQTHSTAHTHHHSSFSTQIDPQDHDPSSSGTGTQLPRDHFHCETCDLQRERRERREAAQRHCQTVAGTFAFFGLLIFFFLIFTIPSIVSILRKGKD